MKRFHDADMQRAWEEAEATERERDDDPERKQQERDRLIRWAFGHQSSTKDDDSQICRGGFLGLIGIRRKHFFSHDYGGTDECWRWRCDAMWDEYGSS